MNTAEYNFLIGVGSSHSMFIDLAKRVGISDQFSDGDFTAKVQELYASLRGRKADRLDCHSNGAMVCLAALSRGDLTAGLVRLFGPQITPESLKKWQRLLDEGKVASIEIHYNVGDPIAPASYFWAELVAFVKAPGLAPVPMSMSHPEVFRSQIRREAPGARIVFHNDCPEKRLGFDFSFECHDAARYQQLAAGTR